MKIALLPGDGIGPEVTAEAVRILKNVAEHAGTPFSFTTHAIGGVAIDSEGAGLPEATLEACLEADAVLLARSGIRSSMAGFPPSVPKRRSSHCDGPSVALPIFARRFAMPRWPSGPPFKPSVSGARTC